MNRIPQDVRDKVCNMDQQVWDNCTEVGDFLTVMNDFYGYSRLPSNWTVGERVHGVCCIAATAFDCMRKIGVVFRHAPGAAAGLRVVTPVPNDDGVDTEMPPYVWEAIELEASYTEVDVFARCDRAILDRELIACDRDPQTLGMYSSLLRRYLCEADEVFSTTAGQRDTLGVVRKICTIACRCVRDHS